ncbi:hypothetical protein HDU67_002301, partial [Dinochytrium kinnereticum]
LDYLAAKDALLIEIDKAKVFQCEKEDAITALLFEVDSRKAIESKLSDTQDALACEIEKVNSLEMKAQAVEEALMVEMERVKILEQERQADKIALSVEIDKSIALENERAAMHDLLANERHKMEALEMEMTSLHNSLEFGMRKNTALEVERISIMKALSEEKDSSIQLRNALLKETELLKGSRATLLVEQEKLRALEEERDSLITELRESKIIEIISLAKIEQIFDAVYGRGGDAIDEKVPMLLESDSADDEQMRMKLSLNSYMQATQKLEADVAMLSEKCEGLVNEKNALDRSLNRTQTEYEVAMMKLQQTEESLKRIESDASASDIKLKNERQKVEVAATRVHRLEEDLQALEERLKESEERRSQQSQQLSHLQKGSRKSQAERDGQMEKLQDELFASQKEEKRLKDELKRLKGLVANAEVERANALIELGTLHELHSKCSDGAVDMETISRLQEEIEALRHTVSQLEEQLHHGANPDADTAFDDRKTLLSEVEDRRLVAEEERRAFEVMNADLRRDNKRLRLENAKMKDDI